MKGKIVPAIMLTLLLTSMLTLAFNIQPVKATGAIYIRADGSIDPQEASISTIDNVTYTFTDNINDSIVVERDSIVVDGADYTVQGTGGGDGIDLSSRSNVTIRNTQIKTFQYGIYLYQSHNNSISGNNVTTSDVCAIMLYCSSCNCVSGNNLTGNNYGVFLRDSPNNTVCENTMANNQHSIYLGYSYTANNTLSGNNITDCWYGIELFEAATNNSIVGNNISDNGLGIHLWSGCNQNTFSGNILTNNSQYGIYLGYSASNRFCHNDLIDNTQQAYAYPSGYANIWDDGYPSGGNYWSNYTGIDLCHGRYQNEAGGDGVGDTQYIIDENNTDRYPLMEPYAGPHSLHLSKTIVGQGYDVSMTATITNNGEQTDTFNVTIYANQTIIDEIYNINLTGRNSTTITFTWDTTGFAIGNYNMTVCSTSVLDETTDNNSTGGWILVTIPGDVDGDLENGRYDVDLYDAVRLLACYGAKEGDPNFDPNCDIDNTGQVFLFDAVILLSHYGQTAWPPE
ncbi:right-handed parallel beta-helix repeat-containing protein [Candidatus Bathyarchaeota archaeon]|nr:right-handed parallel beta-helix repeat-containing protein [Candidatus Bathyarchaeota archaeon]